MENTNTLNEIADYRKSLDDAIFAATGTKDVMNIPFSSFEDREKINTERLRGNVNLMNGRMLTVRETANFVDEVAHLKMP
ncbi:MAG: hypothetical protein LBK18_06175 [Prevotellaceae bacterium]|jgi:hypothetical protein|nr:hypothetical protein [Prevotellaceae bacterium]